MNFHIKASFIKSEGKESIKNQISEARSKGMTWDELGISSPVSKTTMYRWMHEDMSIRAQSQRQVHPRRGCSISPEEKERLIMLAKERRNQHLEVSIEWTRQAIKEVTEGRVPNASNGFISTFWKNNGWPSRRTQKRNQKEVRETLEKEVKTFRETVTGYVNSYNILESRIFMMDETGLWNGSVASRTYVDPESMDSGVVSEGNHRRDTGVVAISASGTINPYFIRHTPQLTKKVNGNKIVLKKKVSGMGLE
ncbi:hypothetical protein GPJ56_003559 [Histomonas meleagridis]|uniref:uncharacterized protein n=1 Tax=Histomonas meleagridis TaxID=135588 RepID=UPI0035593C7E|nr:hypothetical protein GPJ56_003559 [Histomonas meleagridis]KAH0806734.1 hypothetical protein GO595_000471 [Histomonas meleagridis]